MAEFELPSLSDNDGNEENTATSNNAVNKVAPIGSSYKAKSPKQKRELDYFEKEQRNNRRKAIGASSAGLLLVGGIVGGLLLFDPFSSEKQNSNGLQEGGIGTSESQTLNGGSVGNQGNNGAVNKPANNQVQFWESEDGNVNYPVKMKEWERELYNDNENQNKQLNLKYSKGEFGQKTNAMPSETSGFTSDVKKMLLPDKTLNPAFTYVTADDYKEIVGGYIERLVNPEFGGWDNLQRSDRKVNEIKDGQQFHDMFTKEYLKANESKPLKDYIPIYADWGSNDYGMKDRLLPNSAPRWVGTIDSTKTKFTYNDETSQYSSKIIANITYKAWATDQTVLTKKGMLTLDVVTNTGTGNKLLISNASLVMQ